MRETRKVLTDFGDATLEIVGSAFPGVASVDVTLRFDSRAPLTRAIELEDYLMARIRDAFDDLRGK